MSAASGHRPPPVSEWLRDLRALEVELHHPGARCSTARLLALLHPAFHEVGRSGRTYGRDTVVSHLASLDAHPAVQPDAFAVSALADDVALLTYRSAQVAADGTLTQHTLRMSVWVWTEGAWRMRYHQGTPAAEAWPAAAD